MEKELKEDQIRIQQERRRIQKVSGNKKELTSGRQLENTRSAKVNDDIPRLDVEDLRYWNHMVEEKLCASRDVICEMMAFCFDKSAAAQHIFELLKGILMDNRKGVSVETKIARLYLMSDILYNSQQPGVKNAFRYRDAIEEMAKDVFKCLGAYGNGSAGRMTKNKLRNCVKAVLSAWAKWSVYSTAFLDELESLFEGKSIEETNDNANEEGSTNKAEMLSNDAVEVDNGDSQQDASTIDKADEVVKETAPMSMWISKTEDYIGHNKDNAHLVDDDIDGEDLDNEDLIGGLVDIDDLDGESLHESDIDEEELSHD